MEDLDKDYARLKRELEAVSLRKQLREENMAKRYDSMVDGMEENRRKELMDNINVYVQKIRSNDYQYQLEAISGFQTLLSIRENIPIDEVISSGAVTRIIEFVNHTDEQIRYMSLWALTNIAAGKHENVAYLIDNGVLSSVLPILWGEKRSTIRVYDQACWVLGNIAGDCAEYRDLLLERGVLPRMLALLEKDQLLKIVTWAISNLCRGKPGPKPEMVREAIPYLIRLIRSADTSVKVDSLWALAFLTENADSFHESVATESVCGYLISTLSEVSDLKVVMPTLRIVGNLVSNTNDKFTTLLISYGLLNCMNNVLNHERPTIRKEACWTLSNVLAGQESHIMAVLNAGLIPVVVDMLEDKRQDIVREATWCIANGVSGSNQSQIECFVMDYDVISILCHALSKMSEPRLLEILLDSIDKILEYGVNYGVISKDYVIRRFIECNGQQILEDMIHKDFIVGDSSYNNFVSRASDVLGKLKGSYYNNLDEGVAKWDEGPVNGNYYSF